MYIDLNPVRAGIVQRPEEYDGSSIYYRAIRKDKWMLPLSELTGLTKRGEAIRDYKARLYFRGNVPREYWGQSIGGIGDSVLLLPG
ncbi:MAG: hypothetical protein GY847_29335 [Proteobacteria bacterium]|nr:hypothetical protein [Pseudomonadota bacterium]